MENMENKEMKKDEVNPYDKSNFITRLTIDWLTPLIWSGAKKPLKEEFLPPVAKKFSSIDLSKKYDAKLSKMSKRPHLSTVWKMYWHLILLSQTAYLISRLIKLFEPICIRYILETMFPTPSTEAWLLHPSTGFIISGVLCVVNFLNIFIEKFSDEVDAGLLIKIYSLTLQRMYMKILRLSTKSMIQTQDQSFVSQFSTEVAFASMPAFILKQILSAPLIILVSLGMLFFNLSWMGLTCLVVIIITIPTYVIVTRVGQTFQSKMFVAIGETTKVVSGVLKGIRLVKVNVWESSFMKKMNSARKKLGKWLFFNIMCYMIIGSLSYLTPIFMQILMFSMTYFMDRGIFTVSRIFSSMSYTNMIATALQSLSQQLGTFNKGLAALKRLDTFLILDEKVSENEQKDEGKHHIVIKDGVFQWPESKGVKKIYENPHIAKYMKKLAKDMKKAAKKAKKEEEKKKKKGSEEKSKELEEKKVAPAAALAMPPPKVSQLDGINMEVEKGKFYAIYGSVGSGKSTLLTAIVNELDHLSGHVKVSGKISYAPQVAWIQNATVKENIIFGESLVEPEEGVSRFEKVVDACSLRKDIEILKEGVNTDIGESGVTLSGGQKMRINVGRCVYADADIYILDDVFASVDPGVGNRMFNKVLLNLLRKKTRILVTNNLSFFPYADHIFVMKDMKIVEEGSFQNLIKMEDGVFSKVVHEFTSQNSGIMPKLKWTEENEENEEKEEDKKELKSKAKKDIMQKEEIQEGNVKFKTFWFYFQNLAAHDGWFCTITTFIILLVFFVLAAIWTYLPGLWLNLWVIESTGIVTNTTMINSTIGNVTVLTQNTTLVSDNRIFPKMEYWHYLIVYVSIALLSVFVTFFRYFTVAYMGYLAGNRIFAKVVKALVSSPLSFFQTTPIGRILSRLSRDQIAADLVVLWVEMLVSIVLSVGMGFAVLVFTNVFTLIPVLIITPLYVILFEIYRRNARQITRITANAFSPVVGFFAETISGIKTIRSFKKEDYFIQKSAGIVDKGLSSFSIQYFLGVWLRLRLNLISFVFFSVTLFMIVGVNESGLQLGGLVKFSGMGLSSSLYASMLIAFLLMGIAQIESNFNSIERLSHYALNLVQEKPNLPKNKMVVEWPKDCGIEFKNVSMKYRKELDIVIKKASFAIKHSQKIGIVGRTGSGKSSIYEILMRTVEPEEGSEVIIDGVDVTKINLDDLRGAISVIPQNPHIFAGSIKENLDPQGVYKDSEIWEALEKVELKEHVEKLEKKIDTECKLSVGQSQLLCLGRALLQHQKIICLDEATANIDLVTEKAIQKTIQKEFKDCTLLVIAHRVNTICESDMILVMDDGEVVEFDSPKKLVEERNGVFFRFIKELGKEQERKLLEIITGVKPIVPVFTEGCVSVGEDKVKYNDVVRVKMIGDDEDIVAFELVDGEQVEFKDIFSENEIQKVLEELGNIEESSSEEEEDVEVKKVEEVEEVEEVKVEEVKEDVEVKVEEVEEVKEVDETKNVD